MTRELEIFGDPFDPWDAEDRLQVKRSAAEAVAEDVSTPYRALLPRFRRATSTNFIARGECPVESWLLPQPPEEDAPLQQVAQHAAFMDAGGCTEHREVLTRFVGELWGDGLPVLFGVDHSATGAAFSLMVQRHGAGEVGMVVLDRHSDFISMEHRYQMVQASRRLTGEWSVSGLYDPFAAPRPDAYNRGNFLAHMVNDGLLLPEHLAVLGVCDRPAPDYRSEDPLVTGPLDAYRSMEKQACIVAREDFSRVGPVKAVSALLKIKMPSKVYVSIDLDVGAVTALRGVRDIYPPDNGLSAKELTQAASALGHLLRRMDVEIAGIDLMEVDVFRAASPDDRTYELAVEVLKRLLSHV